MKNHINTVDIKYGEYDRMGILYNDAGTTRKSGKFKGDEPEAEVFFRRYSQFVTV